MESALRLAGRVSGWLWGAVAGLPAAAAAWSCNPRLTRCDFSVASGSEINIFQFYQWQNYKEVLKELVLRS